MRALSSSSMSRACRALRAENGSGARAGAAVRLASLRPPSTILAIAADRRTSMRCRAAPDVNANDDDDANIVEREMRVFRGEFSGSHRSSVGASGVEGGASALSYVFRDVAAAEVYAFDVEAVAGPQLAEATRACAVRAARAVFGPERVPPGGGDDDFAYRAALDATLPAVSFPYEAAILARLLVDEGLVVFGGDEDQEDQQSDEDAEAVAAGAGAAAAAAATAGGAAPSSAQQQQRRPAAAAAAAAAQRAPPPPTTTRPLLPAEIVEHWDEVRATCLARWARERGGDEGAASPADVDEELRAAFLEAQLAFEFADEQQQEGDDAALTTSRIARFGPRRAAAAAAATAAVAAASATLARAVAEAPDLVYVLCAGHARRVAAGALSRAGVGSGAGQRRGLARSAARCVPVYAPTLEDAAAKALDLQDARDRVRFVFDRPSRAERVRAHLEQLLAEERERQAAAAGGGGDARDPQQQQQQQPQQQQQQQPPSRATVHVAEGVCAAASHRAAAAASGALMSERELLEGLGVANSPAVMDGVDWRR